ncbi:UNVERIFIED_CONTAM: hypothetical protein GTU68_064801 [Idotea baltica]|nr:hypothetical protein [Idotea baltica]
MKRKNGAYILTTFLPCFILEIIGLLTLVLPFDDYQDRVTVTLSCLIVMSTLFAQTSSSLPASADPKLIDIWMFIHISLLFLVFIVHVGVIYIHKRSNHLSQEKKLPTDQVSYYSPIEKIQMNSKVMVRYPKYS